MLTSYLLSEDDECDSSGKNRHLTDVEPTKTHSQPRIKMKYQTIPTTFRGGFLLTLSLLICQFSTAQDNPDEQEVFELEEFVVSGQRATNRNSIDDRKNNDSLVDSVGSDELGGLPDRNLGEALGRLAGVTTVEDEGVGRYATVRGLKSEYVNVTLDGGGFSSAARPCAAHSPRATNLHKAAATKYRSNNY